MTTKEEALKLADELDALHQYVPSEAPAMIRRLVEELDKPHPKCDKACMYLCETKPLSDDETIQLACDTFYGLIKKEERDNFIRFARAIEERHGIK